MTQHNQRPPRIVIIGGGFAGAMTAIKLLDQASAPLDVTIIEPRAELGRGVAYSTREDVHLVNGPARIFSLHPQDPDHFVRWLDDKGPINGWTPPADIAESHPSRWLFGMYVGAELNRAVATACGRAGFHHNRAIAARVRRGSSGLVVETSAGDTLSADTVVLALGVFQRRLPVSEASLADHPRYVGNPWEPDALDRLAVGRHVLIVGASLSMVDVIASLEARGFRGRYTIVSRRGQLVDRRRDAPGWRDFLSGRPMPRTARALLAAVRAERRASDGAGLDWQGFPFAIRPWILPLWRAASDRERLRFARHLRAFWDVVVHRAAPETHDAFENARAEGRVVAGAGRVVSIEANREAFDATVRWRRSGEVETLSVDGVVNCRGHQEHDWLKIDDPLVRDLLETGMVRPHSTGFGIDATDSGVVIGQDGQASGDLVAIGHPLRGVAWESSSIPEQLQQAIDLAELLAGNARLRATA